MNTSGMRKSFRYILTSIILLTAPNSQAVDMIDTHSHFNQFEDSCYPTSGVNDALAKMATHGISQTLIMSQPLNSFGMCHRYDNLKRVVEQHPTKFILLGGGATLNPTLQEYSDSYIVPDSVKQDFKRHAFQALKNGAVGFGEITAEHFSFSESHLYSSAPPDHPLMLLLADIAARYGVPIDLHMEAITENLCTPQFLKDLSSRNPQCYSANIARFEALLKYNRDAKIVWVHAGWGHTGERNIALMRRLLNDHPNLYMNLKFRPGKMPGGYPHAVMDSSNNLKSEWRNFFKEFPDRFMVGEDMHYPNNVSSGSLNRSRNLIDQLYQAPFTTPADAIVRDGVAFKNARDVYRLNERMVCHRMLWWLPFLADRWTRTRWVDLGSISDHIDHGDSLGPCR